MNRILLIFAFCTLAAGAACGVKRPPSPLIPSSQAPGGRFSEEVVRRNGALPPSPTPQQSPEPLLTLPTPGMEVNPVATPTPLQSVPPPLPSAPDGGQATDSLFIPSPTPRGD